MLGSISKCVFLLKSWFKYSSMRFNIFCIFPGLVLTRLAVFTKKKKIGCMCLSSKPAWHVISGYQVRDRFHGHFAGVVLCKVSLTDRRNLGWKHP